MMPNRIMSKDSAQRFRGGIGCALSACTFAPHDDLNGLHEDGEIEQQAMVLHVEQIVLQFLSCILLRGPVRITQLRPSRDAGLDGVTLAVIGNSLVEFGNK